MTEILRIEKEKIER